MAVKFVLSGETKKRWAALTYWLYRKGAEGTLHNNHFEYMYTDHVGVDTHELDAARILDIGCGPRGSLEWADNAAERIGIDPIADKYRWIGGSNHAMEYVEARAESIPYNEGYFDVVYCGNVLDHVEDVNRTVEEIKRVTSPGGVFVLITELRSTTDVKHPQQLSEDVLERLEPEFKVEYSDIRAKLSVGVYEAAKGGPEYDASKHDTSVLSARLRRTSK